MIAVHIKTIDPKTGNISYSEAGLKDLVLLYQERFHDLAKTIIEKNPNEVLRAGYIKPSKTDCKGCYYFDRCPRLGKNINANCFDFFRQSDLVSFNEKRPVRR